MPLNEKQNQRIGCAVIIVAAIGALLFGLWLGPFNGEICQKDEYTGKKDCAVHNVTYVATWEVGRALEDYSGAITGIATLLLAYITWKLAALAREQSATTRAQLRAYLSVVIGNAIEQNSAIGFRFQAEALLKNGGQTPAYNVRWEARAAIVRDIDCAAHTFFLLPPAIGHDTLGAGETRIIEAVVPHLMNDVEVDTIKLGLGQALWIWGTVQYEDIFKETHTVRFSHRLHWIGVQVFGRYNPGWSGSD